MTLPRFQLHRPSTIDEAVSLLEEYGDDAALYCGGTELVLLMKLGFAEYGHLIDIKGIDELHGIDAVNGTVRIGAATTHRQLERSDIIRDRIPGFAEMERSVANIRVRNAGSLGGNLCFADPHSDPATFLLAADAELECRRADTMRVLPVHDFLLGPFQTVLEQGEMLAAIRIPTPPTGAGMAHHKLSFHERPAATVSCLARVNAGVVTEVRVAVGSVGSVPVRAPEAEALLVGNAAGTLDLKALEDAGEAAARASNPVADSNGSPEYKRALVRVLVRRSFDDAVSRAMAQP